MCMEYSKKCECGSREASFHFQDNIMPPEVIGRLYCPDCQRAAEADASALVEDNGWAIEFDMELAAFSASRLPSQLKNDLTPSAIFDGGYATWRGVYPGDHIDSAKEREEIVKIAMVNPREYITKLRDWANQRMDRLAREGWRKANAA